MLRNGSELGNSISTLGVHEIRIISVSAVWAVRASKTTIVVSGSEPSRTQGIVRKGKGQIGKIFGQILSVTVRDEGDTRSL